VIKTVPNFSRDPAPAEISTLSSRAKFEPLSNTLHVGVRFVRIMYPLAIRLTLPLAYSRINLHSRETIGLSVRSLIQHNDLGSAYLPGES